MLHVSLRVKNRTASANLIPMVQRQNGLAVTEIRMAHLKDAEVSNSFNTSKTLYQEDLRVVLSSWRGLSSTNVSVPIRGVFLNFGVQ